jgi:hypothetical protein
MMPATASAHTSPAENYASGAAPLSPTVSKGTQRIVDQAKIAPSTDKIATAIVLLPPTSQSNPSPAQAAAP